MATTTEREAQLGLAAHGIQARSRIHWQPTTSLLYSHALARGEGRLAEGGPIVVDTGAHTGRSPKDKFLVREPGSAERIWWSDVNAEIAEVGFEGLREKVVGHLGVQLAEEVEVSLTVGRREGPRQIPDRRLRRRATRLPDCRALVHRGEEPARPGLLRRPEPQRPVARSARPRASGIRHRPSGGALRPVDLDVGDAAGDPLFLGL